MNKYLSIVRMVFWSLSKEVFEWCDRRDLKTTLLYHKAHKYGIY